MAKLSGSDPLLASDLKAVRRVGRLDGATALALIAQGLVRFARNGEGLGLVLTEDGRTTLASLSKKPSSAANVADSAVKPSSDLVPSRMEVV